MTVQAEVEAEPKIIPRICNSGSFCFYPGMDVLND